jgi:hypothetical protein
MPAGRLPNVSYERPDTGETCLIAICKHCGGNKMAKSTTREQDHLENKCKKFKEWECANMEKSQTKIEQHVISKIDSARKARIDQKLAYAIYKTGQPFTAFECLDRPLCRVWV